MPHKSSSPLIGWFDTAVVCLSNLCVMQISQSRLRRTQLCSLCVSYDRVEVVDPPPPAESMGNKL